MLHQWSILFTRTTDVMGLSGLPFGPATMNSARRPEQQHRPAYNWARCISEKCRVNSRSSDFYPENRTVVQGCQKRRRLSLSVAAVLMPGMPANQTKRKRPSILPNKPVLGKETLYRSRKEFKQGACQQVI